MLARNSGVVMTVRQPNFTATGLDTYAVAVLCAQDATSFFGEFKGTDPGGNPTFPPRDPSGFAYLHDTGTWTALGQLRADANIVMNTDETYFGMVMKCINPSGPFRAGDVLVAIKGTSDLGEWLDNAASVFQMRGAPNTPGDVASGFWRIYQSLTFANLSNTSKSDAVRTISGFIEADAALYVVGHSLGGALGTYLTYDFVQSLGRQASRVMPYFFASPKTGTVPNVRNYLQRVPFYNLVNYENDLVPKLPFEIEGFSALLPAGPLHNVMTLRPGGQPYVPAFWDVPKNHSAVLYARLLDPTNLVAQRLPIG